MTVRLSPAQAQRAMAKGRGRNPETIIQNAIRDYLRQFGWYVVRIQQGMGCHKGVSDLIVVRDGRVVFCEVKTADSKQSAYQRDFEREITNHGGEYVLARCVEDAIAMSGEAVLL